MKKIIAVAISIALILCLSCEQMKKKKAEEALVEHQSYTTRFLGYKNTVEFKVNIEEAQNFLQDTKNIFVNTSRVKISPISPGRLEKPGDSAEYKVEVFGISFPIKLILVYNQTGEEFWYLTQPLQKQIQGVIIVRVRFKESRNGTRVTVSLEVEEESANLFLKGLTEVINIPELMAEVVDKAIAQSQVHFDPSLTVEGLLRNGRRGEFYDNFYTGNQFSILVNSSPEKIGKLLTDPEVMMKMKEEYSFSFNECLLSGELGPCPVSITLMGLNLEGDSFVTWHNPLERITSYWAFKDMKFLGRAQVLVKPQSNATKLTLDFLMEPTPVINSPELVNLVMTSGRVGETFEKLLLDLKTLAEGN